MSSSASKCWVCGKNAVSGCSNCHAALYCSGDHQKKDWDERGHDLICHVIDNESNDKDAFLVNVEQFMKSHRKVSADIFAEIIANAVSAENYSNKSGGGGGGSRGRRSGGGGSGGGGGGYPSDHTTVSPEKARQILRDGEARGHPLTPAQRGFFGAVAGRRRK